ncbi:MAG: TolC family protein [Opitutaceae bacterium]|nr:TolC family protein [Opitutaceae bacterium]
MPSVPPLPVPAPAPEPERCVTRAIETRPELAQARLDLEKDRLEIVRTANGLLPVPDLFTTLGNTSYSDTMLSSFRGSRAASRDVLVGLRASGNLHRRAERAAAKSAKTNAEMGRLSLVNLERTVERDVRDALLALRTAEEKVKSTAVTSRAQQAAYEAEQVKFDVGRSDAYTVAQAHRDATAARVAEARARVDLARARIELDRLDGDLLDRFGIVGR